MTNHRTAQYLKEIEASVKGVSNVDYMTGTHKSYHLAVVEEYRKNLVSELLQHADSTGIEINTDAVKVTSENLVNGSVDICIELSHNIFKDLRDESRHERLLFLTTFGDKTGLYYPIEESKVERIILEVKLGGK